MFQVGEQFAECMYRHVILFKLSTRYVNTYIRKDGSQCCWLTWIRQCLGVIFHFNYWWTSESPRAHVAKFYNRLRLIRSVLRVSKFSVLKVTEIVILWVYYTIPFGFSLYWHFSGFGNCSVWLRFTDEGLVPKLRIWSILLIKSDLNGEYILVKVSVYIIIN